MKTGIIISGGSVEMDCVRSWLRKNRYDALIAADRGILACEKLGIIPDLIVGDFDSAGEQERARWKASGVPVREFTPEKDWTDTELAVDAALEQNWEDITIFGATGTRLDHVLGNFQVLALPTAQGVKCQIIDSHNRIHMHRKPFSIRRSEQWGKYVSLFAFGGDVTGLKLTGFYYNVTDFTLPCMGSRGVSNQITEETACVDFLTGTVLVIESRD